MRRPLLSFHEGQVAEVEKDAVLDLAAGVVRLHDLVVAVCLAVDGGVCSLEEERILEIG
jgi:hypothetical protein